jgi:hypothetical protein
MGELAEFKSLNAEEWAVLVPVVDILFPAEPDGIGAIPAGVLRYIDGVLAGRASYLVDTYQAGIRWLHGQARAHGADRFDGLGREAQEAIVAEIMGRCQAARMPLDAPRAGGADEPGLLFMTAVWQHTREGLFGDPRHGGNREGMVWKWLGYNGPQLNGYTDSEILENETPRRPLRFAEDWKNHRG